MHQFQAALPQGKDRTVAVNLRCRGARSRASSIVKISCPAARLPDERERVGTNQRHAASFERRMGEQVNEMFMRDKAQADLTNRELERASSPYVCSDLRRSPLRRPNRSRSIDSNGRPQSVSAEPPRQCAAKVSIIRSTNSFPSALRATSQLGSRPLRW